LGVFGDLDGFHAELLSTYNVTMPDFCPDGKFYRAGERQHAWAIGTVLTVQSKSYVTVFYGSWSDSSGARRWNSYETSSLSARCAAQIKRDIKEHKEKIENERESEARRTANQFNPIFESATSGDLHPYMASKGLDSNYVAKVLGAGELIVPMYLDDKFRSVQVIKKESGEFIKRFPSGTGKKGSYCLVGGGDGNAIFISEGFATACSVFECMPEYRSYCAFDCGNLIHVAAYLREKNPDTPIVICADHDASNAGLKAASACVQKIKNLSFVIPPEEGNDFNDMFTKLGPARVTMILTKHLNGDHKWPTAASGFIRTVISQHGEKKTKMFVEMYEWFAAKSGLVYARDSRTFYAYVKTHYKPISDEEIRSVCEYSLGMPARGHDREEFLKICRTRSIVSVDDFFKEPDRVEFVNFKNGVIDLKSGLLVPHDKRYRFRYEIDNDIDMKMKTPTWNHFLKLITKDRQHLIDNIEEFIGFALSGEGYFRFNVPLILDGAGSNGKSTLIQSIMMLLGQKNTSSVSLSALSTNRFLSHELAQSMINVSEEEPKTVFSESGAFKRLTGNSAQFAEEKGKPGYSFVNKSKIIISYNEVPFLGDESTGMLRRLLIIPCEQNFDAHPELKIENVLEKLKAEAPGILAKCLAAYLRLSKRGHFVFSEETKARIDEMRRESNPVRDWILDMVELKNNDDIFTTTEDLWSSFEEFVGKSTRYSKVGFMKKMLNVCRALDDTGYKYRTEVARIPTHGTAKIKRIVKGVALRSSEVYQA
jgi:P4 family phage/plasmid primase-like protien